MKKVISGLELQENIVKAIDILCGTVKKTLGPLGNNVIIDHSSFTPYITNDGVTIADAIESDDPVINTILTLIKEASIKTNEVVGDGTTTTLVLLESIYKLGLDRIRSGKSSYELKKEIDKSLNQVIDLIKEKRIKQCREQYINVAALASNDSEIGRLLGELYVKYQQAIEVKEGIWEEDVVQKLNGYYFDSELASPYFLNNEREIKYDKSYIFMIDEILDDVDYLANIINFIIDSRSNLLIIANDYSDMVVNTILNYNYDYKTNIVLTKCPEYGYNKLAVMQDIAKFCKGRIIRFGKEIKEEDLGISEELIINERMITIINSLEKVDINDYINCLEEELNKTEDEFKKEFIRERINKFKNGKVIVNVGGITKSEIREKKMRYDDAVCALNSLSDGVLIGGGYTLLKVSDEFLNKTDGDLIIKDSLLTPFKQLIENVGIDYCNIIKKIRDNNYSLVYNVANNQYEKVSETKIFDSYNVVITALKNACSIATLLLTTSSLVINEYKVNEKINFNEEI